MFWDIILAALISMMLGFIWYGPLFGQMWLKAMKITPAQIKAAQKKGMPASTYPVLIISAVLTAVVLSLLVPSTAWAAVKMASLLWLGFVAATMVHFVLFESKPWKVYLINVSYYLVSFALMALVFAGMN